MKAIKTIYQFTKWPNKSLFHSEKLFINRTDIFPNYRLSDRDTLYIKHSYRDTYVSHNNPEDRILMDVINCGSFEAAKEQLLSHLGRCADPRVPRLENRDWLYDIAYGNASEERIESIAFLRGNTFIRIQHIGLVQDDIRPFLEILCREEENV